MADSLKTRVGRIIAGSVHALVDHLENHAPLAVMEQSLREADTVIGEVLDAASLEAAAAGCGVGYYLVHSMIAQKGRFAEADRAAARRVSKRTSTTTSTIPPPIRRGGSFHAYWVPAKVIICAQTVFRYRPASA